MIDLSGLLHPDQTVHMLLAFAQFWFWMRLEQDRRRMKKSTQGGGLMTLDEGREIV